MYTMVVPQDDPTVDTDAVVVAVVVDGGNQSCPNGGASVTTIR